MKRRQRTALDDGSTSESDAAVLTVRLGGMLNLEVDEFFRPWGITVLQFNVLRILYVRDEERRGISRGALESLLIRRVPDVTRLLDRLEAAGLIERYRPKESQRTVLARLTDKGFDLVEQSHTPLLALNRAQFAHMSRAEVQQLVALLHKALQRPTATATAAK
jgi:DNA-binding MarR family transcriptional regulator